MSLFSKSNIPLVVTDGLCIQERISPLYATIVCHPGTDTSVSILDSDIKRNYRDDMGIPLPKGAYFQVAARKFRNDCLCKIIEDNTMICCRRDYNVADINKPIVYKGDYRYYLGMYHGYIQISRDPIETFSRLLKILQIMELSKSYLLFEDFVVDTYKKFLKNEIKETNKTTKIHIVTGINEFDKNRFVLVPDGCVGGRVSYFTHIDYEF